MPAFKSDVEIEVNEFFDSCDMIEREELVEILIEEGLVNPLTTICKDQPSVGVQHELYAEALSKLESLYFKLSLEEIESIIELSKKY